MFCFVEGLQQSAESRWQERRLLATIRSSWLALGILAQVWDADVNSCAELTVKERKTTWSWERWELTLWIA